MIRLIATVESLEQAEALLPVVDCIYFGEEAFGLRLPHSFTRKEQQELIAMAHQYKKEVLIAVNGIIHPEKMRQIPEYLTFLKQYQADAISLGDPGIIHLMNKHPNYALPFIYDGETMVTSARQINFWARKGASGAVLAREVPFKEIERMEELAIPVEVLIYGATCIHQSKRPLLQNYYRFTKQDEGISKDQGLFLSEPKKPETHYSIFEDQHGTHIFANHDIALTQELLDLAHAGFCTWKLDGIYTPEKEFIEIVKRYDQARHQILNNEFSSEEAKRLGEEIRMLHPVERTIDTGFFYFEPDAIK